MLADLQQEFCDFIRVGKGFLESCLWMTKFATKEDQLAEIKQQLGHEQLDKLKAYLYSLSSYLGKCEESFAKFGTAHKNMMERVSSAENLYLINLKKHKKTQTMHRRSTKRLLLRI